jgi:dethiobiotin synthetase
VTESARPRLLLVVAGTGTEVGKTFVASHLLAALAARGLRVAARKPVQSFAPAAKEPTDAELLGAATGEAPERVCPRARSYPLAMAPPMAAEALGREAPHLAGLVAEVAGSWPRPAVDVGLVELAGGVRSPLAHDGDGIGLVAALAPDLVLLVADAALGALNLVKLAGDALAPHRTLVHLNRYDAADEIQRRNRAWLAERMGLAVTSDPAALLAALEARLPSFCRHCGREACPGTCARPLDPPRFCPRCGKKLVVQLAPTGQRAHCREHGALRV